MRKRVLNSSYRNLISLTCFLLSLLVLVMACATPATTTSTSPTTKPTSTGPKSGGTLRISTNANPTSLDATIAAEAASASLTKLYSATLVRWTGKNDVEGKLVGWLAKSWQTSPDGKTLTFKLNEGVKWQNVPPVNGREFTSEDVKFHFDRILDPKTRSAARGFLVSIDRIDTPDKYTVVFNLKQPDPSLLPNMAAGPCAMISKEVIAQDGNGAKTQVGPGPFILKEKVPGSRYTFEKNPDYFEKGLPYLDKVEVFIIADEAPRLAAFRAGELDRMQASKTVSESAVKSVPGAQVFPGEDPRGQGLFIGVGKNPKPFGDARVRQAIAYALDYDGLIAAAFDGAGYRSDFMGPKFTDFGARTGKDLPQRDIAKAKALMAEAGYAAGFKTEIAADPTQTNFPAAEPIAAMLKEIGITAEIKSTERAELLSKARAGDIQLLIFPSPMEKPDPDMALQPIFDSKGANNYMAYSNPKIDELIQIQRNESANIEKRTVALKEIMTILAKEQPMVPLCVRYLFHTLQPWVRNWDNIYDPTGNLNYHQVVNVWLDK